MCIYLDDISVTGTIDEEHLHNLNRCCSNWRQLTRLKKEKCVFLLPRVDYLGHGITSNGLEPAASKVATIVAAPAPKCQRTPVAIVAECLQRSWCRSTTFNVDDAQDVAERYRTSAMTI